MKKIICLIFSIVLFDVSEACSFGTPKKSSSAPYPSVLSMSPNTKVNAIATRVTPTEITAFSKLEKLSANFGSDVEDLCIRVSESLERSLHIQNELIEEINTVYLKFFPVIDAASTTDSEVTDNPQTTTPK